jgi:hypothetical protein
VTRWNDRWSDIGAPLTSDDIVDRAAARERRNRYRWVWWLNAFRWVGIVLAILAVGLYQPTHAWLHTHLEFLWGVLAGSLLQVPGWLRDRWRWMKWFSWQ